MKKMLAFIICLSAVYSVPALSVPQYKVIPLAVSGTNIAIHDINESGQICGTRYTDTGKSAVVINVDGSITELGTFGRDDSEACGFNDKGQVVGYSIKWTPLAQGGRHGSPVPFFWDPNTGGHDFPTSESIGVLYDITNSGLIAANLNGSSGYQQAYFLDTEGLHYIGSLGSVWSSARAINECGEITGISTDATSHYEHGFFWRPGEEMVDIGSIEGTSTYPVSINNRSQIVGYYFSRNYKQMPFYWDPTSGITTLGDTVVGGEAEDINDSGQVVGTASWDSIDNYRMFVWEKDKGFLALQSAIDKQEYRLTGPLAINNKGWIAINGYRADTSGSYVCILEPVPEPSSLVVMLCGVCSIAIRRKK